MTQTQNYGIDQLSGEVETGLEVYQAKTSILDLYVEGLNVGKMPVHLAMAMRIDAPIPVRLKMVSEYTNRECTDVGKLLNKAVTVIGAAVIQHGAYQGQDGNWHAEGYKYLVLKTTDSSASDIIVGKKVRQLSRPVMIKTSAGQVIDFFLGVMGVMGWFDWPAGIQVAFSGNKDDGYTATMLDPETDDVVDSKSK